MVRSVQKMCINYCMNRFQEECSYNENFNSKILIDQFFTRLFRNFDIIFIYINWVSFSKLCREAWLMIWLARPNFDGFDFVRTIFWYNFEFLSITKSRQVFTRKIKKKILFEIQIFKCGLFRLADKSLFYHIKSWKLKIYGKINFCLPNETGHNSCLPNFFICTLSSHTQKLTVLS